MTYHGTGTTSSQLPPPPPPQQQQPQQSNQSILPSKSTAIGASSKKIKYDDEAPTNDPSHRIGLFASCQIFVWGWDDETSFALPSTEQEDIRTMKRMIRRGWGLIHWALQDAVTHVIVKDLKYTTNELGELQLELMKLGRMSLISFEWVKQSWDRCQLQDTTMYPPRPAVSILKPSADHDTSHPTGGPSTKPKKRTAVAFYRDCLFVLQRVTPPRWGVDFPKEELENLIHNHGGQILSPPLVRALREDRFTGYETRRRKCHIICWGGYKAGDTIMDPLVAQIKEHDLCDLCLATPVWIRTCAMEQRYIPPETMSNVFEPSPRPLHAAFSKIKSDPDDNLQSDYLSSIRICISGFTGHERIALIQLIQTMGGTYDDYLRTSTTHLICREPKGAKYEQAVAWKRHILSVDWLFHIASHGYYADGSNTGCEHRFALTKDL